MQVPLLDLKSQYRSIRPEIDLAVREVLESGSYVLGKKVQEFEVDFAESHRARHCVGLSSGTDANHLSLATLGIGPGDEVIVPVNTFVATVWGATLCGARPVFVDCDPTSYNIDPSAVERAIGPRTKAIISVHLYGQPADLNPLLDLAKVHGLFLVEDCAQAHLAEYENRPVGGIGVAGAFSFYPGKNLGAYGEAGALVTNDDGIADRARMYRDQGQSRKYYHDSFGHNYRMEALQGAVLGVKLKHLDEWTKKRRSVASKYGELLAGLNELVLPKQMTYAKHVFHLFVVRTPRRDALKAHLEDKGIGTGLHYPIPLHLQKAFKYLGYNHGDFPNAEKLANEILSLPIYPELGDDQITYVADSIIGFFQK
jgi:dTDP-4-amino-4,6-dideoxygalactose transaminase